MRLALLLGAALLMGCGAEDDSSTDDNTATCEHSCQSSTAASGDTCQANLYCDSGESAVYCGLEDDGTYSCSCGAAVDNPPEFSSDDFCDLEREEAICAAIAACSNWIVD